MSIFDDFREAMHLVRTDPRFGIEAKWRAELEQRRLLLTSMEAFGPVSVDYFNGRTVEAIVHGGSEGDGSDYEWALTYVGGGLVANYDPNVPAPPVGIVGCAQTLLVVGASETVGGKPGTLIYYGDGRDPRQFVLLLNPMQYAMLDTFATNDLIVFPQRSEADMEGDGGGA